MGADVSPILPFSPPSLSLILLLTLLFFFPLLSTSKPTANFSVDSPPKPIYSEIERRNDHGTLKLWNNGVSCIQWNCFGPRERGIV